MFSNTRNIYGRKSTQSSLDRRYGPTTIAKSSLCDGPNHCIDANKTTHAALRYANDARGIKFKNNSCFRRTTKNKKYFTLQSTQRIKPNQEIHADYGRDYWPREYYKNFFFEKNGRKEDKFI